MAHDTPKLHRPWLVAVWPGMGHVAISAGYYLMAKLHMDLFAEVCAKELFDVDAVEIRDGLLQAGEFPRSRFFVWHDPEKQHDLIVFIGEAQPPLGKYVFCRRLIELAKGWGVERVFTFASMATDVDMDATPRVFCTASDRPLLDSLQDQGLSVLTQGQISGLNGLLLAAAVEAGLEGACLLGEMPAMFAQLPFPKAALAVLQAFTKISSVPLDLTELEQQSELMNAKLAELLAQVERAATGQETEEESEFGPLTTQDEPADDQPAADPLTPADRAKIESLFTESTANRSKAYELKRELDRLEVFPDYEDRFLDLFKKKR